MKNVGRWSYEGPTRVGAHLPPGRTLLPHGRLIASPTSSPSLLVCFQSKKDQSSRPNQTDNSKRLAKISNHTYKNSEKNQILFKDNLDHKSTIHRISANTPQKVLHRIYLQKHRGELCIENQRERRSHLDNNYGPEGLW